MTQTMLASVRKRFISDPNGNFALIERLFREYGRRYWKRYAWAIACMSAAAVCFPICTYLLGSAVNAAYLTRDFPTVLAIGVSAVALFTLRGFATYSQTVAMARIGNEITAENQQRLFDKLVGQDLAFFADRHSSELIANVTYGANSASSVLGMVITVIGRDVLTFSGLCFVMAVKSPALSLVGLFVMPPAVLTVRHLIKRVRLLGQVAYGNNASFLETLQEMTQGIRVVKALGLEEQMRRAAQNDVKGIERSANKLVQIINRSTPMMETLAGGAIGLILIYGGYFIILKHGAPGGFVSFITAFLLAYEPGKRLTRLNVELGVALVSVRLLFSIIDLPDRKDQHARPALKISSGRVVFHNVNFAYRSGEPVLRHLSLAAEPGQVTALVGPSGSGKSTIFNLLLHFYEAQSGSVTIDDQKVAEVNEKSLRDQIAYVGQDIFLFRGSIRRNIAFGRYGASDEDIVAAARAACAHEFISQFPAGYDTQVGEHGTRLSTGQRQRIAIARALIRNAPIVLLDEPTGSLDSESERHVQEAFRRLCEGRTTLVIAHRLYTITRADVIYVIQDGMLAGSGNHELLLRENCLYNRLFNLQFAAELSEGSRRPAAELVSSQTAANNST